MSDHEGGTTKTAAVCAACGDMYTVRVSPDGSVDPIGVTECACGTEEFRPLGATDVVTNEDQTAP